MREKAETMENLTATSKMRQTSISWANLHFRTPKQNRPNTRSKRAGFVLTGMVPK